MIFPLEITIAPRRGVCCARMHRGSEVVTYRNRERGVPFMNFLLQMGTAQANCVRDHPISATMLSALRPVQGNRLQAAVSGATLALY
jgi:hypothetical protein